jgi:hypothetical protein
MSPKVPVCYALAPTPSLICLLSPHDGATVDCLPQTPIIAEPERSAKALALYRAAVLSRLESLRWRQLSGNIVGEIFVTGADHGILIHRKPGQPGHFTGSRLSLSDLGRLGIRTVRRSMAGRRLKPLQCALQCGIAQVARVPLRLPCRFDFLRSEGGLCSPFGRYIVPDSRRPSI